MYRELNINSIAYQLERPHRFLKPVRSCCTSYKCQLEYLFNKVKTLLNFKNEYQTANGIAIVRF